jgi:hypothetical protein
VFRYIYLLCYLSTLRYLTPEFLFRFCEGSVIQYGKRKYGERKRLSAKDMAGKSLVFKTDPFFMLAYFLYSNYHFTTKLEKENFDIFQKILN